MFCCFKQKQQISQRQKNAQNQKVRRKTLNSAWEVPVPESKNIQNIKKVVQKQGFQSQLAQLQNNSQIMLFNVQQGRQVAVSFNIKKTIVNFPAHKRTLENVNTLNEQHLYEILGKRYKNQLKLIISEHRNDLLEKKYTKYNDPFNLFMIIPQQTQYIYKHSLKQKNSNIKRRLSQKLKTKTSKKAFASMINSQLQEPQSQKIHTQCFPFSITKQLRLNQFEDIIILPPFSHSKSGQTLSTVSKIWLSNIIQSLQNMIQKVTIILPEGTKITEVFQLISQVVQTNIKNENLQSVCKIINFQLQCIYIDFNLKYVFLKKRRTDRQKQSIRQKSKLQQKTIDKQIEANYLSSKDKSKLIEQRIQKQNDLILMMFGKNLFMIQFSQKSKFFYDFIFDKLKQIKFIEYIKIKCQIKKNNTSKKSIQKLFRQLKWGNQQFYTQFNQNFTQMKRIIDTSGQSLIFKIHILKQMKLLINEYLTMRKNKTNSQLNENLQEDVNEQNRQSQNSSKIQPIIPSYQQYIQKQVRVQSLHISSEQNSVKYQYQMQQQSNESKKYNIKSSFSNEQQLNLIRKQTSKNRKNSNDY